MNVFTEIISKYLTLNIALNFSIVFPVVTSLIFFCLQIV